MRTSSLIALLALPLLSAAQSSGLTANSSVQLSTSLSAVVTLGPNRQESTVTQTFVFTITPSAAPSANSSNSTASGNSTATASGSSNSSSQTTTLNLPTAPTNIDGGGSGGAPSPGASGSGGIYGPDDGYIAAATALKRNALLVGVAGMAVGGALVLL